MVQGDFQESDIVMILSPSLQGMYSGWPATFNRHSLVIRRINFWALVLTWMVRTCLSWSGNTSSTQPRRHWPRGAFWSTTSTTSLTFRFFLASLHFFCMLSVDRYSSLQHFQNTLTRFWISLQWFLGLNAMSSVAWGASCPPSCPTKKRLGVNTGSSHESAPWYINGLKFINASTSLIAVCSSSLVSPAISNYCFQSFLGYFHHRLKHPTKVWPQQRIPIPADSVIGNVTCNLFLIHCLKKFSELSLCSHKVCPIITTNFFRSFPSGYHSAEHIQEFCGAQWTYHF